MNRYLMLSAAALVASTGWASAAKVKSGTLDVGSGCTFGIVQEERGVYVVRYGDGASGQGLSRKTANGKAVELSDNVLGSDTSTAVSFDISLPLKNGGTWALWTEFSGTTAFIANSGNYSVCAAPKAGGGLNAETKALIERLKAARRARG
jgi:hypothetical protein